MWSYLASVFSTTASVEAPPLVAAAAVATPVSVEAPEVKTEMGQDLDIEYVCDRFVVGRGTTKIVLFCPGQLSDTFSDVKEIEKRVLAGEKVALDWSNDWFVKLVPGSLSMVTFWSEASFIIQLPLHKFLKCFTDAWVAQAEAHSKWRSFCDSHPDDEGILQYEEREDEALRSEFLARTGVEALIA